MVDRRTFLGFAGALALPVVAGCTGGSDGSGGATSTPTATATASPTPSGSPVTEVAAGPEKRLRFDPEEIEIARGTTVRWTAKSAGHNVTSKPGASEKCENPDGAEPFASYEGDKHYAVMEVGETYEHEFTVPGEYVYVCAPHAGQGMVGYVTVTG